MTLKQQNKLIKSLFIKYAGSKNTSNYFRYNDKRKHDRRIAYKSYGSSDYQSVWSQVLAELTNRGVTGYQPYMGCSHRGDGSVYGLVKLV